VRKARKRGLLPIGRVSRAHGVHGALEFFLYSGNPEVLSSVQVVVLGGAGKAGADKEYEVKRVRPKREKRLILELVGLEDRTSAELLKGCEVLCRVDDLPELESDEFYWFEIEGFVVVDLSGNSLGVVKGCLETGGHDLIVCEGEAGEFLVPLVADIVKEIRKEEEVIVVDPPPGLIEANAL